MTVDTHGFDLEMRKQKERARNAAAVETGDWVQVHEGEPEFVGYDLTACESRILRYRKVKQKNRQFYQIVFEKSPFYAEMGGQVGDSGVFVDKDGKVFRILIRKEKPIWRCILAMKCRAIPQVFFVSKLIWKNVRQLSVIIRLHTSS